MSHGTSSTIFFEGSGRMASFGESMVDISSGEVSGLGEGRMAASLDLVSAR